jgi:hypothetical protein
MRGEVNAFKFFRMISNKVPDNEIARRAGHADPVTPKRLYGHVYASMKDEAASAIENALKPVAKKPEQLPTSAKIIAFPEKNLA